MGVRKGISVTPNVCSFVVQACGQAELQVRTPQISVPDPFPTSISSVLVVQCGGSNSWLSSSWSSFSPPRPAPEQAWRRPTCQLQQHPPVVFLNPNGNAHFGSSEQQEDYSLSSAAVRRSRGPSQTLAMEGLSEPPVLPLFRCRT